MNPTISRRGAAGLTLFAIVSVALFAFLSVRTGGPGGGKGAYVLRATFHDAEGVAQNADVLVHGVNVGRVRAVDTHDGETMLTLALDSTHLPLRRDASARIGQKTPLGESYVDLAPGRAAGPAPASGSHIATRPSVELDEALAVLDAPARRSLRDIVGTLGPSASSREVSATIAGLHDTIATVDRVAGALHGQEPQVAGAVSGAQRVLGTLGSHDASLRSLVRDGRTALEAAAAQRAPLRTTIEELPDVTAAARTTLADARPLIAEAQPAAAQLGAAAPDLSAALEQAPPTLRAARSLIAGAPALRRAAEPALAAVRAVLPLALPAFRELGPALADIVPMARYMAPRANTAAAWFANTADLGSHGDAKGRWARFFVMLDPSTATGTRVGGAAPGNSYTAPNDAAHNAAFAPGGYPRLLPFGPALRRGTAPRSDGP